MADTRPAGKRIALAIGNGAYVHAPPLNNAHADASGIAEKLKAIGFTEVTLLGDLGYEAMRRALQLFGRAAGDAEMAIVYYAGHAIELDGENHLVPVDARLEQDRDVMFETVPLSQMLRAIDGPGVLRLAILDACRDSPFPARMQRANQTRAIRRGLADIEPGGNTLVAFSAKGGTVALDGEGPHSPFAQALMDLLPTPGLEVGFLFRQVRDSVLRATGRRQEPYLYGSLGADPIFLAPTSAKPPDAPQAPDVFISYASGDRDKAEDLARELEAEGYRVWWDTKLLGGQQYRKAIVSQLEAAHAAIVIWTASSVESDWVYDEANRARAAGKLIPVRAAELDPKAIQPPFGALHTILVGDRSGLRAALARQGVTPASTGPASPAPAPPGAPVDDRTLEHGYWTAIQASDDPCDFETFLEKFPHGVYAPVARKRVESLLTSATAREVLRDFLRDHDGSERAATARTRLAALDAAAAAPPPPPPKEHPQPESAPQASAAASGAKTNWTPYLAIVLGGAVLATLARLASAAGLFGIVVGGRVHLLSFNRMIYVSAMVFLAARLARNFALLRIAGLFLGLYALETLLEAMPYNTNVEHVFWSTLSMMLEWTAIALVFLSPKDKMMFVIAAAVGFATGIYFVLCYALLPTPQIAGYVSNLAAYPLTGLCIAYGFIRQDPALKTVNWLRGR
jgi:hypothetical protein